MLHTPRHYLFALLTLALVSLPAALAQEITLLIHPTLYEATGGTEGVIPQFTADSGVVVNVVTAPSSDLREKAIIDFVAGSGRYDVVAVLSSWMNDELLQFLEPLDACLADAGPDYDVDDLIPSLVMAGRDSNGDLKAVPFRVGTAMLYYNKDLFAGQGIEVPQNWDQFLEAARALTLADDQGAQVYGVGQTLYPEGKDFIRFIYAMGGNILNEDMTESTLQTDEVRAAVELFRTLFEENLTPEESLAWDRDPQITALQQGRIAMGVFYSPYWGRLIDPEGTDNPDKFGWALVPTSEGVTPGRTLNDGWFLAIDRNSDNKEAACGLIKALTNKANQETMALEYANGPVRTSVYNSDAYKEAFPLGSDWQEATAASEFAPPHPRFAEIQDILNDEITSVLLGRKSTDEALSDATDRINPLLR